LQVVVRSHSSAGKARSTAGPQNFVLARYNTNGSLDTGFDGDGKVVTDFGAEDFAFDVAVQSDGKVVAAGGTGPYSFGTEDFALTRYNQDGTLDGVFGGDGRVITDIGASERANGVAIQSDGKIVAAGWSDPCCSASNFALARYTGAAPVEPQISINDIAKPEGNAGVTASAFTVSLTAASPQTITVSRQTETHDAVSPSDYTALNPGTITFSPGQTTKTVTVKVNGCTITGTTGDDVLTGTSGADVICGGPGDDQLYGLDGGDNLKGGDGNDLLVGGNGHDLLIGGAGAMRGESANDTLRGGDDGDTLNGGANSDALFGDAGADSVNTQDSVSANDSADGGVDTDSCVFDSGDFVTSCP
jgi:uncharacterized delta-60 repeat protein